MIAQRDEAPSKPSLDKDADVTFGIYKKQDGQLGLANKVVLADGKTLKVDDKEYKFTPGLITPKHPRRGQWNYNDYQVYKSLVVQTKVKSFPNRTYLPAAEFFAGNYSQERIGSCIGCAA